MKALGRQPVGDEIVTQRLSESRRAAEPDTGRGPFRNAGANALAVQTVETDEFTLVFLGDGSGTFSLELTYIKGRTEAYDIGEAEYHLALTSSDMAAARKLHEEMGCVAFVNEHMGIYFIEDPDGYWIEIIPEE